LILTWFQILHKLLWKRLIPRRTWRYGDKLGLLTILITPFNQHLFVSNSVDLLMHLPEHICTNHNVMTIMDLQAEWFGWKHAAVQWVWLGKEHLEALQAKLLEAERNLQEVDSYVDILHSFICQTPYLDITMSRHDEPSGHTNTLFNTSDASSEDSDSGPVTSSDGWTWPVSQFVYRICIRSSLIYCPQHAMTSRTLAHHDTKGIYTWWQYFTWLCISSIYMLQNVIRIYHNNLYFKYR